MSSPDNLPAGSDVTLAPGSLHHVSVQLCLSFCRFDHTPLATPNGDVLIRDLSFEVSCGPHRFTTLHAHVTALPLLFKGPIWNQRPGVWTKRLWKELPVQSAGRGEDPLCGQAERGGGCFHCV